MIETIDQTMRIFGEDRTAYTPNEVKTFMELRDKMYKEEILNLQVWTSGLIVVSAFLGWSVVWLW